MATVSSGRMESPAVPGALYARGFLLTEQPVPAPRPGWRQEKVGPLHLWYDPRTLFWKAAGADRSIAVLGHFVDVREPGRSMAQCVSDAAMLERDVLLVETDYWSGRFVLLSWDAENMAIVPDAAATRSLYYHADAPFVASSHAALVAETTGAELRPEMQTHVERRGIYGFPGDATLWRQVYVLTPNQTLDPATRKLTRFWPREPLRSLTVRESAAAVSEIMRATVAGLVRGPAPVFVSLTAGLDTRTTLAACRDQVPHLHFFTFSSGNYHRIDMDFAADAAARLGLTHTPLNTSLKMDGVLIRIIERNTPRPHFRRAAYAYWKTFPHDAVHLRSSTGEIGRCFYRDPKRCFPLREPADLVRAWDATRRDTRNEEAAFEAWADRASFWSVDALDRFDLFNWEHRFGGAWHSGILLEADIAWDTHVMYNCRALFKALLGVPKRARHRGAVFHEAILLQWPQLLEMPVNGAWVDRGFGKRWARKLRQMFVRA